MPGQAQSGCLVSLAEHVKNTANENGGEKSENSNCAILPIEKGPGSFEDSIRYLLHRWRARGFAQNGDGKVNNKKDGQKPYPNRYPEIVAHNLRASFNATTR